MKVIHIKTVYKMSHYCSCKTNYYSGDQNNEDEMRNAYNILVGKPEDLGVDGKIISEWILGKWDRRVWTGFIWLRIGTSGGSL
jgi:hypothetical protein